MKIADDITTGLSNATAKQKWLDDLGDGVYRNGNKAEYINPSGKVLKWTDQSQADITNSIQSKLVRKNADDFINPHGKKPVLYIDEPLPRQVDGSLFPSNKAYIDGLRAEGIEVVNSLSELKQILQ